MAAGPTHRKLVSVSTEAQLRAAIGSDVTIEITADIYLTSTISIYNKNNLVINGNGHKVDGQGVAQCFYISGSTSVVEVNDLTITNGYDVRSKHLVASRL